MDFVQGGWAMPTQASALYPCAGRRLLRPQGPAMLLAARVLFMSLACLLRAHCWAPCWPLSPGEALLLLALQVVPDNAELRRSMETMMAQQAAWAASGPMHGAVPGYELGRPYHLQGEPDA